MYQTIPFFICKMQYSRGNQYIDTSLRCALTNSPLESHNNAIVYDIDTDTDTCTRSTACLG